MTSSAGYSPSVSPADSVDERVRARLVARIGDLPLSSDTELAAVGIDSLMTLRVIADLAHDPTQEIDPQSLAEMITVGDLVRFVEQWNR